MDNATKTVIYAAKTTSKRVFQENAEPAGDLIGNKIADKFTSVGKTKSKEKEEIYIPPEKRQQIIDDLKICQIQHLIMYLDLVLKNGLKFMICLVGHIILTKK